MQGMEKKFIEENNNFWLSCWQKKELDCHRQFVTLDLMTYFKHLNLYPGDYVLVPLCGESQDMLWLAEQGYCVIGVELSSAACQNFFMKIQVTPKITKEKNFIRYQSNNITLFCGDFFKLSRKDFPVIHAIYDCRAFVALPSEIRRNYIQALMAYTSSPIKILLMGFESPDKISGPPFSVNITEINELFGSHFNIEVLKFELLSELPKHLAARNVRTVISSVYLLSEHGPLF